MICGLLYYMDSPTHKASAEQGKAQKEESVAVDKKEEKDQSILHEFKGLDKNKMITNKVITILVVAAVLGIGTGYMLSHRNGVSNISSMNTSGGSSTASSNSVEGSNDLKTFKDIAEGQLETGGIDGEGQFHLVRPGGDSQNVYLVSSIVDLSKYVGKKVKVWGQTQSAQKAGWLMDVGRIQAL